MNKSIIRSLAVATVAAAASLTSHAATLDFTGLPFNNPSPLVLSNATITNLTSNEIFVGAGAAGQPDGFCFKGVSFDCEGDGEIAFNGAVFNLAFDVDGAQPGDSVAITAFNGAVNLGTLVATADGNLDFSGFGQITRLFFNDSSTAAGVGYSTFAFDTQPRNNVPEPSSLALAGLALLGLVAGKRRRKSS